MSHLTRARLVEGNVRVTVLVQGYAASYIMYEFQGKHYNDFVSNDELIFEEEDDLDDGM